MRKILALMLFILIVNTSFAQRRSSYTESNDKTGVGLIVGGVAFTAAAILEGPGSYGTWKSTPNSTSMYNTTYVQQPFWKQTPRNIMLVAGVSVTITGLISVIGRK